jgi:hypothetical protein
MRILVLAGIVGLSLGCAVATDQPPQEDPVGKSESALNYACFFSPWKSCTSSWQCPSGETCYYGTCRIEPLATRCESATVSRNKAGDREDCGGYKCNPANGKCFTTCTSSDQCNGFVCDTERGMCETSNGYWVSSKLRLPPTTPDHETSTACDARSCSADADCGNSNYMCKNGKCMPYRPHCTADHDNIVDWARNVDWCGDTTCSDIDASCLAQCYDSQHCQVAACNWDRTCHW